MDESDLASWEVFYDGSTDDAPDRPPTDGDEGRYLCATPVILLLRDLPVYVSR